MGTYTTPDAFVFNDGNSTNNILPWMMASMNGGGGFGGGYNSPFWALIMLAFLRQWGWDGNGYGGNNCNCLTNNQLSAIQETLNTNQGNQLLMNAITTQGTANVTATKELASAMNCNYNAVQTAINGIQSAICNLGSKNDMNSMQIVNAINSGNSSLANQLSTCCCDVKQLVTNQGYENRIATLNQTNQLDRAIAGVDSTVVKGFCDTAYATQQQTNALAQNNDANTRSILAKLDQIEDSRKDREISQLTAALASVNARAERQAELAPIVQKLNDIQCRQPQTVTLPYSCATAVPTSLAWQAAYGLNPYVNGGNFG